MGRLRVLYLGFAFPPGLQSRYPHLNPAGHAFEVQLVRELRKHVDLRTVGLLPIRVPPLDAAADAASGIAHELTLEVRRPELLHQFRSLWKLLTQYRRWRGDGWHPDIVLSYNLSPVYNAFVRKLRHQTERPKAVLLLLDSSQLGRSLPSSKRIRYCFKPLVVPDVAMVEKFDACIGLSQTVSKYFQPRNVPFLWMPGACTPSRYSDQVNATERSERTASPTRFGYFGALAAHAGIGEFTKTFLSMSLPATFHVCGYGKLSAELAQLAAKDDRLEFLGLLPRAEDCLRFGASCDVLVNPRPSTHGNENNFASKVFEYALCGRAVLTSRLSGVEQVLGNAAYYFDPNDFENNLRAVLSEVVKEDRSDLRQRGRQIRDRVCTQYNWPTQARRVADFLANLDSA
jgi:glycosyltransferase involved in cell wall biosynthesis